MIAPCRLWCTDYCAGSSDRKISSSEQAVFAEDVQELSWSINLDSIHFTRMIISPLQLIKYNFRHGKNRTIVRRGDPGRHYYFIYSGQVELRNSNTMDHVHEKNLPKLGTGQDFGVSLASVFESMCVIDNCPKSGWNFVYFTSKSKISFCK